MVRTRLNIGCRYSTPVRERPLHPTRGHFTPEPSQTQAPVTPATEPERRAGGSLTTGHDPGVAVYPVELGILGFGPRQEGTPVVPQITQHPDRRIRRAGMMCSTVNSWGSGL